MMRRWAHHVISVVFGCLGDLTYFLEVHTCLNCRREQPRCPQARCTQATAGWKVSHSKIQRYTIQLPFHPIISSRCPPPAAIPPPISSKTPIVPPILPFAPSHTCPVPIRTIPTASSTMTLFIRIPPHHLCHPPQRTPLHRGLYDLAHARPSQPETPEPFSQAGKAAPGPTTLAGPVHAPRVLLYMRTGWGKGGRGSWSARGT